MDYEFATEIVIDGRTISTVRGVVTIEPNPDTPSARAADVLPWVPGAIYVWTTPAGNPAGDPTLVPLPDRHCLYEYIIADLCTRHDACITRAWNNHVHDRRLAARQRFRVVTSGTTVDPVN